MANTVFAKILRGDIPADLVHEDEHCIAFRDINPQAPVHVLVIPRKEIVSIDSMEDGDAALLGHLMTVARDVARTEGVAEDGYRLVINNGAHAGQTVFHLHIHVLGGRTLGWPPG
jgi:histidine triad (HIT) family protein